jgi:hypothetical protein
MRVCLPLLILVAGCASDDLLLPDDRSPTELRAVSGDGQSAPAGDPVRHPLVVEALDRARRPVAGALIVFEFLNPPNGAEIAPVTTETDDAGRASAEVRLGESVGDQPVEARLNDPASDLRVEFALTALQPNRDGGGGGGGGGGDDGKGKGKGNNGDDDDD